MRGQKLLQYTVVLYYKALLLISSWPTDGPFRHHLKASKAQYITAALTAIKTMSVFAAPSLSLLQALLSGVRIFPPVEDIGLTGQSFTGTSHANARGCIKMLDIDSHCDAGYDCLGLP